ncbi:hypothetical protein C0J52_04954 [Blattella germanica]|nr:hypothetical protein C0J52_04954 [Blattella germanica]
MNSTFSKGGGEEQSYPQLDLSGKLIIKAQLGDDVRRIPIHNEAITYDELVLMMQRVFRGKLSSSDDITIKYKDEDGDLITIFDSSDLSFAVQYSRILKLQILVGGEAKATQSLPPAQVNHIRRELQHIRDQVNHLLDSIEPRAVEVTSSTAESRNEFGGAERNNVASKLSSREFDPLQEQGRLKRNHSGETIGSVGVKEEAAVSEAGRGSTPDSIGSSGSRQVSSGFEAGGQQTQPPAQQPPQQPPNFQQPPPASSQQPPQPQLPTSQGYQPPDQQHPPQQPYQQQESEDVIQRTPGARSKKGRKRIRKLAEKPLVDEDENKRTRKKFLNESCSESEPEEEIEKENKSAETFCLNLSRNFRGFPGYPMFMGGQVMGQQSPAAMMVHGQQSMGQPAFGSSPYQSYPPVHQQPGYPPAPQKGGTSPAGYRPSNPGQPTQPQSYPQDYNPQQGSFTPPRFPGAGIPGAQQPQPPPSGNPYSKGAAYSRPPSQPGYQ